MPLIALGLIIAGLILMLGFWPVALILAGLVLLAWCVQ